LGVIKQVDLNILKNACYPIKKSYFCRITIEKTEFLHKSKFYLIKEPGRLQNIIRT